MKRFVVTFAGPVALAAGVAVAPVPLAAVAASQGAGPAIAVAVEGSDGQLWMQAPQLAGGWQPLGGTIIAAPAVAAAPGPVGSTPADPVFIATGTDGALWIRSLTDGWQPVGAAHCIGGPAAVITGSTLTVACSGTDNALWYNTATVPSSGLPAFTSPWTSLGGVLSAGPAVAPVGSTVTFFVRGTSGAIYTRTLTTGYTQTAWACTGAPAAAFDPVSASTVFACAGTDQRLWQAVDLGVGWGQAESLGGTLIGSVGIATAGLATEIVAEGTDHAAWVHGPNGWDSLGGGIIGGASAVALTTAGGAAWGRATEVPTTGTDADVTAMSCPSAGNCTVGGEDGANVFVADEVSGTWGAAQGISGAVGGNANLNSVSCGSAGNCAAVGMYVGNGYQAFVADEVNGTWGAAINVTGGGSQAFSVSCPSAGNCALGGYNYDSGYQAFVADEVNGTWGAATEVPGTAALNTGSFAVVNSVSCASPGNCTAGGYYTDSSGHQQAFVADEVNGSWGSATEVPGTATAGVGNGAEVASVSCGSAGNCVAGGAYTMTSSSTGADAVQAFVADEVNGTWGTAIEVSGLAALNTDDTAEVKSVSCPSAGNCAAVGTYVGGSPSGYQVFVVSQVNGTWGDAIQIPGAVPPVQADSVSCASAGNCVAGGYSLADSPIGPGDAPFVVSEVNGTWGDAIGISAAVLNAGGGGVLAVSCPSAGGCAAGGDLYPYGSGVPQAFVVSQN